MKFKLCVVGHKNTLNLVRDVVREYFEDIEMFPIEFPSDDCMEEIIPMINNAMSVYDGILYSRYESYCIVTKRIIHTIPARYVNITGSDLIAAMLKGILHFGISLDNLSIDSMDYKTALNACISVGADTKKITLNTFTLNLDTKNYVQEILDRHRENYNNGATLCLTNISAVAAALERENIPAALIVPERESFAKEIRFLILKNRIQHIQTEESNKISIIQILLKYKEKFKLYHDMPLREIDEIANASKILSLFAERIGGAVIQKSHFDFIIIGEFQLLKKITENFINIPLLENIVKRTSFNIKMGIGTGENIITAFSDSNIAIMNAENYTGSNAYIVSNSEIILGPVTYANTKTPPDSGTDAMLSKIALESGLSFDNINKIYQIRHTNATSIFTSKELSEFLGVTVRTANRLIEKLMDSGYAVIYGNYSIGKKGRPSRNIKILF